MIKRFTLLGLVALLACEPLAAQAGRITMINPHEQDLPSAGRLCVYSNSVYTFTYTTQSTSCPYTETFTTDESD